MTTVPASRVVPETEEGGRIYQTCVAALVTIRRMFQVAGVKLPDVQFVSNGAVAYDDELLAIEPQRLRPGKPGIPALMAVEPGTPYSLETVVHLLRIMPTQDDQGEAPTAAWIEDSARDLLTDWWVLYEGILLGRLAGSSGDPGSLQGAPYREIMIQDITNYGPAGQVGGLVATLVCELI